MSKTQAAQPRLARKISWVPNQKGAWMMALLPYLTGVVGGGFRWQHILVGALWLSGYSFFFAAENWLKARRSRAYLPPMRLWFLVTAILAAAALWLCGALLAWVLCFLPFAAVTAWQAIKRKNRSLTARTCEVCAAGLMCAVAWDIGVREVLYLPALWRNEGANYLFTSAAFMQATIVTLLLTFYFWSTIPFVKSLVRERISMKFLALSIAAHIVGISVSALLWSCGAVGGLVPIIWCVLALRAAIFRYIAHTPIRRSNSISDASGTSGALKPARVSFSSKKLLICVGSTEMFLSTIYAYSLLLG